MMGTLAAFLGGVFLAATLRLRKERKDLAVLVYLWTHGELPGLDMVKANLGGRGTIYVRLADLERRGLIVSREEDRHDGTLPRRLYRITELGTWAIQVEAKNV